MQHEHAAQWQAMQDFLKGRPNLELDKELQQLQESLHIVVLKFSSSGSDSVVLLRSEFDQVAATHSQTEST